MKLLGEIDMDAAGDFSLCWDDIEVPDFECFVIDEDYLHSFNIYGIGGTFRKLLFGEMEEYVSRARLASYRLENDMEYALPYGQFGSGKPIHFCHFFSLIYFQRKGTPGVLSLEKFNVAYIESPMKEIFPRAF